MINGKTHKQIVFDILKDGEIHYAREFLNAGLVEFRSRISELRKDGYNIIASTYQKRPAYQLKKYFERETPFRRDIDG